MGGAQVGGPLVQLGVAHGTPQFPGPDREHPPGGPVRLHDVPAGVQHHLGHDVLLEERLHGPVAVRARGAAGAGRRVRRHGPGIGGTVPAQDVLGLAHDLELLCPCHQGLGLAEEQVAARVERELEAGQDPGLHLGGEVHQGVPAAEQVDPGDGRVLHQVVPPEDQGPAQVAPEDPELPVRVEETPRPLLAERIQQLLAAVAAAPGVRERPLVGIGGVDLHRLAEPLLAERLGQQDRQRVRLLTGRAARGPYPHRLARLLGLDDPRDHLVRQRVPGVPVAEQGGDVDQDGVEQLRELARIGLEDLRVALVVIDADGLHALDDAPGQAGPLVTAEVEVPPFADIVEQCFQLAIFRWGRHRVSIRPGGASGRGGVAGSSPQGA